MMSVFCNEAANVECSWWIWNLLERNGGKKLKKRMLALILIVSGVVLMSFPAFAAETGDFRLSDSSIGVRVGDYTTVYAYSGGWEAAGVVWTSDNESVATVNNNGLVTGVGIGQTIVTAYLGSYRASCVVNVAYKGIDVSRYQGTIDWPAVKSSGVDFAMIRTGYGSEDWANQTDPYFATNYTNAKAAGVKVGAYHAAYATSVAQAEAEAEFCLHILDGRKLDYPVAYDVETAAVAGLSDDLTGQVVQAFCRKIQAAGYKVIIYSYYNYYNANLKSPLVAQYDTWIAHTGVDRTPFSPYTMWQYGLRSVSGVNGSCDVDYSFYDYSTGGGGGQGILNPFPDNSGEQVFICDTTSPYTFGTNREYTYKITTNDTITPTASSSNPSAVSVSYAGRASDGYLFKLVNRGTGQAVITTTAGNGTQVSFTAVGTASSAPTPTTPVENPNPTAPSGTLKCDTTAPYTFGANSSYVYKITTSDSVQPKAVSSNPSAVAVAFYQKISGGYLFRITNAGAGAAVITTTAADGSAASFTATGTAQLPAGISSDTPYWFTMKKGNSYTYKFTPSGGQALVFTTGNGAVVRSVSVFKSGASYYYKIQAAGAGQAGVYAAESGKAPQRVGIVTVS